VGEDSFVLFTNDALTCQNGYKPRDLGCKVSKDLRKAVKSKFTLSWCVISEPKLLGLERPPVPFSIHFEEMEPSLTTQKTCKGVGSVPEPSTYLTGDWVREGSANQSDYGHYHLGYSFLNH
jgi:hypothetical protein